MKGSVYKRCPCGITGGGGRRKPACKKDHGTWYYAADLDAAGGKRRQEKRGGYSTRDEAQEALNAVLKGVADGTYTDDEKKTVGAFLDEWLATKVTAGLRLTTSRAYRQHIRDYLKPHLGHLRMRELRVGHVQGLLAKMAAGENPPGPATIRRVHATLRSALSTAVKRQMIASNVAKLADLPAATRPKVRPWEAVDLGLFLDSVAADRLSSLFETIASTGLRRGEAVGLRWDDVDLAAGRIVVRQQIVEVAGRHDCPYCDAGHRGLVFGRPKTASSEDASVELDSGTVGVLLAHKLAQDAEREEWGVAYVDHGLVFAREDGNPLPPTAVTKRFAELATAAGVRHVRLHDLRHGAASLQLAAGIDLAIVSKNLRHSSYTITADTYSHLLAGVGKAAAEAAAALVPRARRDQSVSNTPESTGDGATGNETPMQVRDGAPPGTRTPNPRIKSGEADVPASDGR